METKIVFSGLCAFHNVRDVNKEMPEPSVILVRTDDEKENPAPESVTTESSVSGSSATSTPHNPFYSEQVSSTISERWARPRDEKGRVSMRAAAENVPDVHIPHISYDSTKVRVNEDAEPLFKQVPFAPGFRYLTLNGVEIEIENDPPAKPNVDASYDLMVKKDQYWPEAANRFNRDYVPLRGLQPKRSAVVGFMRFGSGTIAAGNLSPLEWKFERPGMEPLIGKFAEEMIYRDFPHSGREVVLRLLDVESRAFIRELRFTPILPEMNELTLFIGNNDSDDIDNAVQRRIAVDLRDNVHFRFLNRVASIPDPGRIPKVIRPVGRVDRDRAGGVSTGPCGPTSSNG